MKKKKIYLYGRHNNRMPFSYSGYRSLFQKYFDFVDQPESADYLISGFSIDFRDNAEEVRRLLNANPGLRLVVVSEEPLWDTLWSGEFQQPKTSVKTEVGEQQVELEYHVLNHVTSRIYEFENIPYFITTSDDFYVRYANLFSRNAKAEAVDFERNWKNAQVRYAFYAARRVGENYNVSFRGGSIEGLNRYRSLVAEGLTAEGVLREGQGWGIEQPRQALPDWHLDKLAALDRRAFVVSGLENTHLPSYVSEKLFDAFAVQAIPLYYAKPGHGALRLVDEGSFINLAGLTVEEALQEIDTFAFDKTFVDKYRSSQDRLAKLFRSPNIYLNERKRVVHETVKAFSEI